MLSQIVRPLVNTQIRLLANSQTTQTTLVETIARWLGYIGVDAQVTQLCPESDRIHVALRVGKPDSCDDRDWFRILNNLRSPNHNKNNGLKSSDNFHESHQLQIARLLAYLIQVSDPQQDITWPEIENQLVALNLDDSMLSSIKSALKVPQSPDLLQSVDPDVAAVTFPIAVKIAWFDQEINSHENHALSTLLTAMK
ncbi:hypothetical protein [Crocosphaera chwakensis]|uniref:Uncharacterized protein n=1 Tax=Crocosphaera chwakensis CCY0110 TaxID=391612 RepID=A3IRX8_9CHRO|nr:hypothetical protein [Crocosphaera chwakensis]EAZ90829.1 hypothetical protein CY0110_30396 [Crocosphaera chwakensis CCY0110]